ncbi:MAG TPA: antitoxin MazE family protein [Allosphingosinicella sp.]
MASGAVPSRDKVRDHRARMRAKGMKLVQMWVPDTNSAEFKAEARRQARAIADSPHEADDQAFVDSLSEL